MERPLTQPMRLDGKPLSLEEYRAAGGYQGLRRALREMKPAEVTALVKESGLRGRGGAGFPTGLKWSFVPMGPEAPHPKYLLANADEMEPGTFKDRWLLEGNPHLVIEGILLAAYAIGADTAFIFLRWAYKRAAAVLRAALEEARQAGILGGRVLDSDTRVEVRIHESAGRYMCGEEIALISALEGRRANPRTKPPFPPAVGLWGQPTVVQNIETLCNVPGIVRHDADWYRRLGRGKDGGTKIFGASGRVQRPGLWELPMGTPIGEILNTHAGGMRPGYGFRGLLPGGASTDFLTSEHLETPMDFDAVQAAGSRLGTGTMIVLDDATCPVGAVRNLMRFFAQESCGWCTPCRDGLPWVVEILDALEEGRGEPEDLEILEHHCRWLGPGMTFCALAPGAVEPLQSALRYFRDDFEEHTRTHGCPYPQPRPGRAEEPQAEDR